MHLPPDLHELARQQRGLLSHQQLLAGGVSRAAVRWNVGRAWRHVLPRVVALFTGNLDEQQRLVAGCLWAGPSAQLAGLTAARFHRLVDQPDDGLVRLQVTGGDAVTRAGFAVRRRTYRPDPAARQVGPIVVCSPARSVVDAARELQPDGARALLISVVQRRLLRPQDLQAEVSAGPVRGSRPLRQALEDVAMRAWSLPEAEVLRELTASTILPPVVANPRLVAADGTRLPTPDFWIDEVALAGQVHSRQHHLRDQDWERTVASDTALAEHGIVVLAVTPTGFRRDPAAFRRRVEKAYLELRATGRRPDVRMKR